MVDVALLVVPAFTALITEPVVEIGLFFLGICPSILAFAWVNPDVLFGAAGFFGLAAGFNHRMGIPSLLVVFCGGCCWTGAALLLADAIDFWGFVSTSNSFLMTSLEVCNSFGGGGTLALDAPVSEMACSPELFVAPADSLAPSMSMASKLGMLLQLSRSCIDMRHLFFGGEAHFSMSSTGLLFESESPAGCEGFGVGDATTGATAELAWYVVSDAAGD
jgi:hypothetical protein